MTLTQLNYIVAVDRCRNFAQAARECFVTQPTLSMQIQKLEDYLQIVIFDRQKSPIEPTVMGEKVIEYARKILSSSQELEEMAKNVRGEVSGEFTLGVIPTLAPYLLPLFLQRYSEAYPRVQLKIYELQTNEMIQYLQDGKIDAGLLATPLEVKNLVETVLFYEPFQVYLSPQNILLKNKKIDESDLYDQKAWLLKEGHCLRAQMMNICQLSQDSEQKIFFEAGSLETLVQLVKNSVGFTILPYLCANVLNEEDKKNLRSMKKTTPVREISFVTGKQSIKKGIEKSLIKVIKSQLPDELKKKNSKEEVISIFS